MSSSYPDRASSRRGFLARVSAAAAAFVAVGSPALAAAGTAQALGSPDDALEPWLKKLTGRHKQLFHSHDKFDGTVLHQARAFIDLYEKSYGVKADQLSVVIAAHGMTGGMMLGDALWSKYDLGKMYRLSMRDPNAPPPSATPAAAAAAGAAPTSAPATSQAPAPTPAPTGAASSAPATAPGATAPGASVPAAASAGAPAGAAATPGRPAAWAPPPGRLAATRNIFHNPQPGDPVDGTTSIDALMKLGVTFLVCDNALKQFAAGMAKRVGLTPEAAHEEIRANLVPGTIAVPTMLIAINRAQERGCSYLYSG